MRNVFTFARLTLKLLVRNRAVHAVLALVLVVSAGVFWNARADGQLINELPVRIQYSLGITYALMTLVMMALACFAVRSQLDQKQIHTVTSRPISRLQIYFGQWLGVLMLAIVAEGVMLAGLLTLTWHHAGSYDEEARNAAWQEFGVVRYEAHPQQRDLGDLVDEEIVRLREIGTLEGRVTADFRATLASNVRSTQQLCLPNAKRTWRFALPKEPSEGETVELRFKYYAGGRPESLPLTWDIAAQDSQQGYTVKVERSASRRHTLKIPMAEFPKSRSIAVTLTNHSDREIILGRTSGVRIRYIDGGWLSNMLRGAGLHVLHLGTVCAVGMMAGIAFTFPVAVFVSLALFLSSMAGQFFSGIARELLSHDGITLAERLAVVMIKTGQWLTGGMQPPELIRSLATGVVVSWGDSSVWIMQTLMYCLIAAALGCVILQRKELSKLQA